MAVICDVIMNTLQSKILVASALLSLPVLVVSCEKKSTEANASEPASKVVEAKKRVPATLDTSGQDGNQSVDQKKPSMAGIPAQAEESPSSAQNDARSSHELEQPFVLESLSDIKLVPGVPGPKVGDTIYSMANLPKDECGEFWVKSSDGMVAQLAVCSGDHEGGH